MARCRSRWFAASWQTGLILTGLGLPVVANAAGKPKPVQAIWYVWCEADRDEGVAPLTVKFTAEPIEDIPKPKYTWEFGDGTAAAKGQKATHVFEKPGRYTVRCAVTDPSGANGTDTIVIDVSGKDTKDAPKPKAKKAKK